MSCDTEMFYDRLAGLASLIAEDKALSVWFKGLQEQSTHARTQSIQEMVITMTTEGEDPILIKVMAALGDPRVFRAVDATLREHSADFE